MLFDCNMEVNIKGVLEMMGRDIPIIISTKVKMKGKKIIDFLGIRKS